MTQTTTGAIADTAWSERSQQLVHALRSEQDVLEELREALSRQREAVARSDHDAVESSIHALGRIILTLEETRRQRRSVLALMFPDQEVSIMDLELYLDDAVPPELLEARSAVRRLSVSTANDLAINQHVLDRVLQAGDAFLQKLFSTALEGSPGYSPMRDGEEHASESVLVNRTI